jgi:hypothetical protein
MRLKQPLTQTTSLGTTITNDVARRRSNELKITLQLVIINIKFVLCYIAPLCLSLTEYFATEWFYRDENATVLIDLGTLLVVLHR